MPVPVRIVKVLAGGAIVEFNDGSTRLVMPETVEAWKRFGFNVKEGDLNVEELRVYKQVVELFPHYSGLPEEEVVPEVIEEVPEAAIVPEVTADSELREGHFGTGWLPDFGHNAKVLFLRELERARNKNETRIEILDEEPDVELEKLVTEIVEGRPVNVDTSEDWVKYGIDPSKDSTDESLLAKELDIPLYPGGVYRPLPTKELPVSIKKAQDIGSIFYKGSDGKKKLALYKSQLKTFEESLSYEEGEGSALSQARKWMELQQGAGDAIDFDNLGGGPKQILNKEWDTVIDVTLPDADAAIVEDAMGDWTVAHDLGSRAKRAWEEGIRPTGDVQAEWDRIIAEQPERTAEVLQAELDAIEKERLALDAELGEFPAQYPPIDELVTQPETVVPREYADAVLPKDMAPIQDTTPVEKESILDKVYDWGGAFNLPSAKDIVDWATTPEVVAQEDAFAKEQKAQQLANEYRDIHQEVLSDFPANRGVNASGTNLAYRKAPTWEELYPLAPQGDSYPDEINTRISGLWPDQWLDPHPLANNIELGAYYRIPVEDRHKIYKPPESRWDASKSAGSVWDRERRADIEGRGMVDEFVKIQEQAEKDALDKAALDEWWAQARAETYQDDLPEFDVPVLEDGQPAGMQEGVYGIPDPLQGDVLNQRWMGLDEVAPYDAGYFEDAVVPEEYWLDKPDETPFLPHFDDRSGYGVGGDIQEFMYNGERWYLTEQGFYAKDYKRSELVTPHQSLPPDFF